MTQELYSRVLFPLTVAVSWAVPAMLVIAAGAEVLRTIGRRRAEREDPVEAQRRLDSRLLLAGAIAGTAVAHVPVLAYMSARLGMLLVLPALGAIIGLTVSGLLPPIERTERRVARLEPRRVGSYVSLSGRRLLWGTCGFTAVLATTRLVLPPETPLSDDLVARLGARPILSPTHTLYVVVAAAAVALTAAAWTAATAVVRRGRPSSVAEDIAAQDRARRETVGRLVGWTTAALLLLNATLMTPLPAKMGGVVFGRVQLVQRATDVLIVAFVLAAAIVVGRTYLGRQPTTREATP